MNFKSHFSGSAGNLYTVELSSGATVGIEAGVTWTATTQALKGVLPGLFCVSHEHGDHARCVGKLLRHGVDVLMSPGTADALGVADHHRVCTDDVVIDGRLSVRRFAVRHDAAEPCGFIFSEGDERLFFASDTGPILLPPGVPSYDIIAIECNYQAEYLIEADVWKKQRISKNHLGLSGVMAFLGTADLSRTREIHLIHGSESHSNPGECIKGVEMETGVPTFWAGKREES